MASPHTSAQGEALAPHHADPASLRDRDPGLEPGEKDQDMAQQMPSHHGERPVDEEEEEEEQEEEEEFDEEELAQGDDMLGDDVYGELRCCRFFAHICALIRAATEHSSVESFLAPRSAESDSISDSGTDSLTWISWFCSLPGHEYFAEVSEDFIEDDFNLTGLNALVPFYKEALEMILDVEPQEDSLKIPDVSIVESSAELLYGLIHQRYILTKGGLQQMVRSPTSVVNVRRLDGLVAHTTFDPPPYASPAGREVRARALRLLPSSLLSLSPGTPLRPLRPAWP